MGFFKNKEDMFKHRADRFEKEVDRYAKQGKTEKADWAKEQVKENRDKANTHKGENGW